MIKPNLNIIYGVYNYKEIIMKTIKLTKNQLKILKYCLEDYQQFLCNIRQEQYTENKKRFGKNLADNLKRLENKLYG